MLKSVVLAAIFLIAPAVAAPPPRNLPEAELAKALAGRVQGRPINCISLSGMNGSQIIEGKAIIYRVGGRLYVNSPRSGAESLRTDDILVTRTSGSQLCSIDTVQLIDRTSRFSRGPVSLGQFIPYSRDEKARLK